MCNTVRKLEGGAAAQTLSPSHPTHDDSLTRELLEHLADLRLILSVVSISVQALHRQDAESGSEIAHVLTQHACDPLNGEIERIEDLLASHLWRHRRQEVHT